MKSFNDFVNEKHLTSNFVKKYKKSFSSGSPFPHIVISNFLDSSVAKKLSRSLSRESFKEKESDLFHMYQTDDLYFSSQKILKEFNSALLSWDFFSFISEVTGFDFSGTLSMSGSRYDQYNHLLCHDDLVEDRKIAYILYLSEGFTKKDGGRLLFYDSLRSGDAGKVVSSVVPSFNTLVLFAVSGKSYHSVEENFSKMSRYAIGGWLV